MNLSPYAGITQDQVQRVYEPHPHSQPLSGAPLHNYLKFKRLRRRMSRPT
jgi:hypothetical protein